MAHIKVFWDLDWNMAWESYMLSHFTLHVFEQADNIEEIVVNDTRAREATILRSQCSNVTIKIMAMDKDNNVLGEIQGVTKNFNKYGNYIIQVNISHCFSFKVPTAVVINLLSVKLKLIDNGCVLKFALCFHHMMIF